MNIHQLLFHVENRVSNLEKAVITPFPIWSDLFRISKRPGRPRRGLNCPNFPGSRAQQHRHQVDLILDGKDTQPGMPVLPRNIRTFTQPSSFDLPLHITGISLSNLNPKQMKSHFLALGLLTRLVFVGYHIRTNRPSFGQSRARRRGRQRQTQNRLLLAYSTTLHFERPPLNLSQL